MLFYARKKREVWIWKAYDRTNKQLVDWEIGDRSTETLQKLHDRLETNFEVTRYYSDYWESYAEIIDWHRLTQGKEETYGVENNNGRQRHWFARYRRRTCVVSRSIQMMDLTMFLFSKFHAQPNRTALAMWFRSGLA